LPDKRRRLLTSSLLKALLLTSAFLFVAVPSVRAGNTCPLLAGGSLPNYDVRVGMLMPLLTTAAYTSPYSGFNHMPHAFYDFYVKYRHTPAGTLVTNNDTNWLKVNIGSNYTRGGAYYNAGGWGTSYPLYHFLKSGLAKACGVASVTPVTDLNVAEGALFSSGNRTVDVLVAGHNEYVTSSEVVQFQRFVASGGRVVLMDGDNWEVEVTTNYQHRCIFSFCFDEPHMMLVQGHSWTYDGKRANHSMVWNQFPKIDKKVTASLLPAWYGNEACDSVTANRHDPIGRVLFTLYGRTVFHKIAIHEPSRVVNLTDTSLILKCNGDYSDVAAYDHRYVHGDVVSYLGTGSSTIGRDNVTRSFLLASIRTYKPESAAGGPPGSRLGGSERMSEVIANIQKTNLNTNAFPTWNYATGPLAISTSDTNLTMKRPGRWSPELT
jgi:hypothetical protein